MNTIKKNVIQQIDAVSNLLPGVIIINDIVANKVVYMSQNGLDILKISMEGLNKMGSDYYFNYFNEEDVKSYYHKYLKLIQDNNLDERLTFFQQVRANVHEPWTWYLSVVKILLQENNIPTLSITITQPVTELANITNKLDKLMEEHLLLKNSFHKFSSLSQREKQVLKLLAQGKTNAEIASDLFISLNTAKTHRKNIKEKLEAETTIELHKYANAFGLI